MSRAHIFPLAFTLSCFIPSSVAAQVPAQLQQAMRARDEAVAKADAATWDRLTVDDFTVVLADGTLMTKAERLAQLKTQKATTPVPVQQVQVKRYGDVFVRRFRNSDAWVLDIWVKHGRTWRVAAVQVTTAKK
jgi:hypothetical protein